MYGECILTISGNELDFTFIEETLELNASKTIKKGEQIMCDLFAPKSIWEYTKQFTEEMKFEDELKVFLKEMHKKKSDIQRISTIYDTEINCYIRSEYGQFGYEFDPEIIDLMSDIGLSISFHILSFGLVE
ncbi:protein of unknown function [Eubacterium ruminantium]|nr:protein of unknown function [Eubacterium ruminantium]